MSLDQILTHLSGGKPCSMMFQVMALIDAEPHVSVQVKALLMDTALRRGRRHSVRDGLQGQYFLPGARPECDAVGTGRLLQGCQGTLYEALDAPGLPYRRAGHELAG